MSTQKETKINQLLQMVPQNAIFLSSWMVAKGYSNDLQQRYIKSGWLESIGNGSFKRKGDTISIYSALYSIQNQLQKEIHIGGRTALGINNISHYIEMNPKDILLFSSTIKSLPSWFKNYDWGVKPIIFRTNFLSTNEGIIDVEVQGQKVKVSSPLRSYFECLYFISNGFDFDEALQVMESLAWVRPKEVQILLENCNSIKVVRVFLFLAEKTNHSWFKHIDLNNINLGTGKRLIAEKGVYNTKYKITVPSNF
jgi:hypothetical protein